MSGVKRNRGENHVDWPELMARARAELDWSKLDSVAESLPLRKHPSFADYLNVETWFQKFWHTEVTRLELERSPPLRILDLGTGPGFFPYLCRCLGHKALGLERAPGLQGFHEWMRVAVVYYAIGPRLLMPDFPVRFDLVTSFRVPFNKKEETGKKNKRELFDLKEWEFFLDDIRDNVLRPGGRFTLKMNAQPGHLGLRYGDPELMDYFASRGALPNQPDKYVTFDPLR
jgi:SAM-dependent methyltransferase